MRRYSPLLLITPFALAACGIDSPVSPTPSRTAAFAVVASSSSAQAAVTSPFHLEFDDFNPCTGLLEHFVFDGTQRLLSFGDHSVLHISGTVTTSDGWAGKFNRQLVNQGGVLTWRFLDFEVGPANERQLFTGILHGTLVDGEIVWSVQNVSLKCIGKPSTQ
jgi:hypothetical protein